MTSPKRPRGKDQAEPSQPERTPDEILEALETRERAFVRAILRGLSPEESAAFAGWQGDRTPMLVLGRPHVRDALLALAPLLATDPAGTALARRILAPYALARVAGLLSVKGQNGLAAARDLLDQDGPRIPDLRRLAEQRARARGGTADNPRSGNPSPGPGAPGPSKPSA